MGSGSNIFHQDRALLYFSNFVRHLLDVKFSNKCRGRGGPILWPALSPVLGLVKFVVLRTSEK